jgi:hypothetical protein
MFESNLTSRGRVSATSDLRISVYSFIAQSKLPDPNKAAGHLRFLYFFLSAAVR